MHMKVESWKRSNTSNDNFHFTYFQQSPFLCPPTRRWSKQSPLYCTIEPGILISGSYHSLSGIQLFLGDRTRSPSPHDILVHRLLQPQSQRNRSRDCRSTGHPDWLSCECSVGNFWILKRKTKHCKRYTVASFPIHRTKSVAIETEMPNDDKSTSFPMVHIPSLWSINEKPPWSMAMTNEDEDFSSSRQTVQCGQGTIIL